MTDRPPVAPGSVLRSATLSAVIGDIVQTNANGHERMWHVEDPEKLRGHLGRGLLARTPVGEGRYREAALLDAKQGVLILPARFPTDDGGLPAVDIVALRPVVGQAVAAVEQAHVEIAKAVHQSLQSLVHVGGMVILEPTHPETGGDRWVRMFRRGSDLAIWTSPQPSDSEHWRQVFVGDNEARAALPLDDDGIHDAAVLAGQAFASWNWSPWDVSLTFVVPGQHSWMAGAEPSRSVVTTGSGGSGTPGVVIRRSDARALNDRHDSNARSSITAVRDVIRIEPIGGAEWTEARIGFGPWAARFVLDVERGELRCESQIPGVSQIFGIEEEIANTAEPPELAYDAGPQVVTLTYRRPIAAIDSAEVKQMVGRLMGATVSAALRFWRVLSAAERERLAGLGVTEPQQLLMPPQEMLMTEPIPHEVWDVSVAASAVHRAAGEGVEPVRRSTIPVGHRCDGWSDFIQLLEWWFENTDEHELGTPSDYEREHVLVPVGGLECFLSWASRAAVKNFLAKYADTPYLATVPGVDLIGVWDPMPARVVFGQELAAIFEFDFFVKGDGRDSVQYLTQPPLYGMGGYPHFPHWWAGDYRANEHFLEIARDYLGDRFGIEAENLNACHIYDALLEGDGVCSLDFQDQGVPVITIRIAPEDKAEACRLLDLSDVDFVPRGEQGDESFWYLLQDICPSESLSFDEWWVPALLALLERALDNFSGAGGLRVAEPSLGAQRSLAEHVRLVATATGFALPPALGTSQTSGSELAGGADDELDQVMSFEEAFPGAELLDPSDRMRRERSRGLLRWRRTDSDMTERELAQVLAKAVRKGTSGSFVAGVGYIQWDATAGRGLYIEAGDGRDAELPFDPELMQRLVDIGWQPPDDETRNCWLGYDFTPGESKEAADARIGRAAVNIRHAITVLRKA